MVGTAGIKKRLLAVRREKSKGAGLYKLSAGPTTKKGEGPIENYSEALADHKRIELTSGAELQARETSSAAELEKVAEE